MRNKTNRTARCAGFTLIELFVVVAIVAVIAAILFPVFATVRERGRRTVCQSNLKQIAIAMQQYVQDDGGFYPANLRHEGHDFLTQWPKSIFPYVKNIQVFRCPDHPRGETDLIEDSVDRLPASDMDYEFDMVRLNTLLPDVPGAAFVRGDHETVLATPSTIWLNMETYWTDGNAVDHYFREVIPSCGRCFRGNTLHLGGGNYSYLDGHVKWLTPEEAAEVECANGPLPAPFQDCP